MKRIFSLVLAVAVLVFSLAVPSYAAEGAWIDLLDYTTPNDCGSNTVDVSDGDIVHFDTPTRQVGYIDFVVQFWAPVSPSCTVMGTTVKTLSCIKLNDYVFRFFGALDMDLPDGIDLKFENIPSRSVQFLNFNISPSVFMSFNSPVNGLAVFGNGEETNFFYKATDNFTGAVLPGSSDFVYQDYTVYLSFPDWKKFDYLDLQFYASHVSISSVSAALDENTIPYEISYLTSDNAFNSYLVNVVLDLTQVDRDTDLDLQLTVTGSVSSLDDTNGYFAVLYSNGLVFNSGQDQNLSLWYRIKAFFSQQTAVITGTIAEWGQKIVSAINPDTGEADDAINQGSQAADELTDLTDQMNSLEKPDLNGAGDISAIISPGDLSSYTVFLSTVVNAPYIGQVVMLALILSLAAYVLFGKR